MPNEIRNRIKSHRKVRAADLVPHEWNFRAHPDHQKAALAAIYNEVGFARSLLAFELPDGTHLMPGTKLYLPDGKEVPDGTEPSPQVGEEKGVDIRLALDLIRLTRERVFDIGLIFSQDQDQAEAVREARSIAAAQGRWLDLYSAFPEGSHNQVAIRNTKAIKIDGAAYAACLDPRNYHSPDRRRRR